MYSWLHLAGVVKLWCKERQNITFLFMEILYFVSLVRIICNKCCGVACRDAMAVFAMEAASIISERFPLPVLCPQCPPPASMSMQVSLVAPDTASAITHTAECIS